MSKIQSVLAVSAAAVVLVGVGAGSANATAAPRHSTALRVTSAHTVEAPKTLQPGIAHLRNTGENEILVLQQKKAGLSTLVSDLNASNKGAAPGALVKDFTLLTVLEPKADAFLPLARGTVFLADAELNHYKAKEITSVSVAGPRANAVLPTSNAITVSSDNLLHVGPTLPTSGYLHLRDRSSTLQEIWLVQVGKKVTAATLKKFIAHPSVEKIADISPDFAINFFGLVSGNGSIFLPQHTGVGRVVALNLVFRPTTKEPVLHKGQARVITVGS